MNLVVLGGTRGVGRAVVVAAHAAGHILTVMARHAGGFAGPVSGVRMVIGDAGDAEDVARAVAGQDAVVWTVGADPERADASVFSVGTAHVLEAMRTLRVRRLVCITGVASVAERGLPRVLARTVIPKAVAEDKARQEALVRASALDWIIVRPAPMTDGRGTGLYQTLLEPAPGRAPRIPRADVADFIVDNLAAPDYLRQTVFLTG